MANATAPLAVLRRQVPRPRLELVARRWEHTVAGSLAAVKAEAERRATAAARQRHSGC
jgi:hypothetical protein